MKFFKLALGVAGLTAALLWAMPSNVSAQRGRTPSGVQLLENQAAASTYWTAARMAAAQPMPVARKKVKSA